MSTKVKICGITNKDDAFLAARAGADYLGFIINFPSSPRNLSFNDSGRIIKAVKNDFPQVCCVGVFVNEGLDVIEQFVNDAGIDVAQLHGQEFPEYCAILRLKVEVWKALIVKDASSLQQLPVYRPSVDKIVLDAGLGSGRLIDFDLLSGISVDVLAGGLKIDNVSLAISLLKPEIVDINSGVELTPGKKDPKKINAIINKVCNSYYD